MASAQPDHSDLHFRMDQSQTRSSHRLGCRQRPDKHRARRRRAENCGNVTTAAAAAAVAGTVAVLGCVRLPVAQGFCAGASHSCAATTSGRLKCWGDNTSGQLGLMTTGSLGSNASDMVANPSYVPLGDFNVSTVTCGEEFTCALSDSGTVKCWGSNDYGQLGLGDVEQRGGNSTEFEMGNLLPTVDLGSNAEATSVSVGDYHACAVLSGGSLKCWGNNEAGQLGYGDTANRGNETGQMGDNLTAVSLGTGVAVTSVSLGRLHTCAVINDGDVKCWGQNNGGQLGLEDSETRGDEAFEMGNNLAVVDLGYGQRAIAVSAGTYFSCALLYTGDAKCWGYGSGGQLGQGDNITIGTEVDSMGDNLAPIDLGTNRKATAISTGGVHACTVLDDSTTKCWGSNVKGSLGQGDLVARGLKPEQMGDNLTAIALTFGAGEGNVTNIVSGSYHNCVSGTDSSLACFGANHAGQLGVGSGTGDIGDEPGEVEAITAINLGASVTVAVPDAAADGIAYETVPPTPPPSPASTTPEPRTRSPVGVMPTTPSPSTVGAPRTVPATSPPRESESAQNSVGDSSDGAAATIGIVSAAIIIPVLAAAMLLYCCWCRRKKKHRVSSKGGDSAVLPLSSRDADVTGSETRNYSLDDEMDPEAEGISRGGEGGDVDGAQSKAPIACGAAALAGISVETSEMSGEALPRPGKEVPAATVAPAAAGAASAGRASSLSAPSVAASSAPSDDDDSSWGAPSDAENPGELRRTGSNSSISTLDSTSTASSTWPSVGFITPARTDIPRGVSGRHGSRSRGSATSASGGADSLSSGLRTPASLAAATPGRMEPDTPSPRSATGSSHGTPHPPEMRLAQFARGSAGVDTNLYGLPEMEVGRPSSTAFESTNGTSAAAGGGSDPSWPAGGRGSATAPPLTASAVAAAAAAAAGGGVVAGTGGGTEAAGAASPEDQTSPTLLPTLTPARTRHRAAEEPPSDPGRRGSGRQSTRSTGTTASPFGDVGGWADAVEATAISGGDRGPGGTGPEAAAQAFAEEAELEALQIDKNDLKLVFGRPFARGKSSEVYQVTHAGKNRAAKIIDLFSLGVVGQEVTRLYASFAQELRAMKGIRHDCVAAVYGAVATPSELTIVTDLVKRGPLRAVLDDKAKRESLKAPARHRIIKDVAAGLAYLWDHGIEHRNLHSHNVLITKEWGAKVADYGLARTTEVMLGAHDRSLGRSRKRHRTPYRPGTLRWTAPEVLEAPADGSDPFTQASDVYSLGVIVWEVLCGGCKMPYDGLADDKVKSMILEGSTPPVSMETPIAYSKLMLLCWRKNPPSRPTFSHIDSVLLKDPPPGAQS